MEDTEDDALLWSVDTASRKLGLSKRYLQILVAENRVPFVRHGRRVLFEPDELKAWNASRRVPAVKR